MCVNHPTVMIRVKHKLLRRARVKSQSSSFSSVVCVHEPASRGCCCMLPASTWTSSLQVRGRTSIRPGWYVRPEPVFLPVICLLGCFGGCMQPTVQEQWRNPPFIVCVDVFFQAPTTTGPVRLKWWTNGRCSCPPGLCCLPTWSRWAAREPFPPRWCTTGRSSWTSRRWRNVRKCSFCFSGRCRRLAGNSSHWKEAVERWGMLPCLSFTESATFCNGAETEEQLQTHHCLNH